MNHLRALGVCVLACSLVVGVAPALAAPAGAKAALLVGDRAPPLRVSQWLKGEPVESLADGNVTVIEFWATWCSPCIANVPHLTALQKRYAADGLRIIGVDVWEVDPARVEPFVQRMGDRMGYRVAVDDVPPAPDDMTDPMDWWRDNGAMATSYLKASCAPGIPCAYIVNGEGVVAWIGNPGDPAFEAALGQVIAGDWDLAAATKEFAARFEIDRACSLFEEHIKAGRVGEAQAVVRSVVQKIDKEQVYRLGAIANALGDPALEGKGADLDFALRVAERAVELSERKDPFSLAALARVLATRGDAAGAVAAQREAIESTDDERYKAWMAQALNQYEAMLKKQ